MYPERYIFKFTNNRDKLWKTARLKGTPIAIRVSLLQFGPSVPSLVFVALFKPLINV